MWEGGKRTPGNRRKQLNPKTKLVTKLALRCHRCRHPPLPSLPASSAAIVAGEVTVAWPELHWLKILLFYFNFTPNKPLNNSFNFNIKMNFCFLNIVN